MKTSILNNSIFTAILVITFSFSSNAQMSAGMAAISIVSNGSSKTTITTKNNSSNIQLVPGYVADEANIVLPVNSIISKTIITDAAGKEVVTCKANLKAANIASINVANLETGFYKIMVITGNGQSVNMKFVKM